MGGDYNYELWSVSVLPFLLCVIYQNSHGPWFNKNKQTKTPCHILYPALVCPRKAEYGSPWTTVNAGRWLDCVGIVLYSFFKWRWSDLTPWCQPFVKRCCHADKFSALSFLPSLYFLVLWPHTCTDPHDSLMYSSFKFYSHFLKKKSHTQDYLYKVITFYNLYHYLKKLWKCLCIIYFPFSLSHTHTRLRI